MHLLRSLAAIPSRRSGAITKDIWRNYETSDQSCHSKAGEEPMAPRLILIGFMATGKSATGRALAARLGWQLIDLDRLIADRTGKPIAAIFAEVGEARFREIEHEVISELAQRDLRCPLCGQPRPMIISPGGGALIDQRNQTALSGMGLII